MSDFTEVNDLTSDCTEVKDLQSDITNKMIHNLNLLKYMI